MPQPSESYTFFIDRSLGNSDVPRALEQAGAVVAIHDDNFPQNCPDAEWLAEVGARGWVVLSKDKRIRRRQIEVRAIEHARVAAFLLTGGDLRGDEMAKAFVNALPRMRRVLGSHNRPLIGLVTRIGSVHVRLGQRRGGVRR